MSIENIEKMIEDYQFNGFPLNNNFVTILNLELEDVKQQIEELKNKVVEFREIMGFQQDSYGNIFNELKSQNDKLEQQIEDMKYCGNCKHKRKYQERI